MGKGKDAEFLGGFCPKEAGQEVLHEIPPFLNQYTIFREGFQRLAEKLFRKQCHPEPQAKDLLLKMGILRRCAPQNDRGGTDSHVTPSVFLGMTARADVVIRPYILNEKAPSEEGAFL